MNRFPYVFGTIIGIIIFYIFNYITGYKLKGVIGFFIFASLTTLGCIYFPKLIKKMK